ncbi:hypothetical protein HQ590_01945 [bacterium]|nr:hypothetical protein [bacterium]
MIPTKSSVPLSPRSMSRRERRRRPLGPASFVLFGLLVLLAFLVIELGRGLAYARAAAGLMEGLPAEASPDVKPALKRFARRVRDHNFIVRTAAMVAMQAATGASLGPDPDAWAEWWDTHGDQWEYRPQATNAPPGNPSTP